MVLLFTVFLGGACFGLDKIPSPPERPSNNGTTTLGTLTIGATEVAFGTVAVGDSAEREVTLTTSGDRTVAVTADLADDGAFSLDTTEVDVTGEAVLTVGFEPGTERDYEGALTLAIANGDTVVLPITGTGGSEGDADTDADADADADADTDADTDVDADGPDISVSETSHDFGRIDVGDFATASFTVSNEGTDDLLVSDVTSSHSVFTTGGTLSPPQVIGPGSSKALQVTFTPDAASSWRGSVTIASDDPDDAEIVVTLSGTGVQSCTVCAPIIDVDTGGSDPFSMTDFVSLGGSTDSKTVIIQNIGDQDLTVSNVLAKNDFLASCGTFAVSGWSGSVTIAPWDSTTVAIEYTATGSCLDVPQASFDANVVHILSDDPAESDWVIELGGLGL